MQKEKFNYDNQIVKWFAYATMLWGAVGMLVGLIVAFQFVIIINFFSNCALLIANSND